MRDRTPLHFSLTFTKDWILQPRQVTLYDGCGNCWQFGIFAFYESAVDGDRKTAVEKIQDRIKTRYEKSIVVVGSSCIITKNVTNIHKVEDSAWAAVCLLIRPNTSEQSNQS